MSATELADCHVLEMFYRVTHCIVAFYEHVACVVTLLKWAAIAFLMESDLQYQGIFYLSAQSADALAGIHFTSDLYPHIKGP